MSAATSQKSFEDLYREIQALPEGSQGEILTPGEIHITMGRPGGPHRRAAQQLFRDLDGADEVSRKGGWWLEVEPEVRFGARLFDPDMAGWRVANVPVLPEDNPITILPDWACEVLSPRTVRTDLTIKLPHYAASGVPFIWIVDPGARLVQVYASQASRAVLVATATDEDAVRLPPFDLDVHPARWWLPEEPASPGETAQP
ncbi:MAG: Uma2 family endonuclease [Labilithrix sp.]|nr:Uma2 family endonuclease [Labilithrix sp.]MCW5811925.1 Uma2 family endonuclease [Labilithrix sp.]